VFSACSEKEAPAPPVIRPVRTHLVTSSTGAQQRVFSGTVQAGAESRLSFKVSGALRTVAVKVGQRVKRGQPIAMLDDRDYRLQVKEASAALAQTRAQARSARSTYERTRRLYENRSASAKDLDTARAAADSAKATVAAAAQRVELARSQLTYCRLEAPTDGEIAQVPAEVNENVRAGQTIAVLISGELPEVSISVPESLITRVQTGDRSTVTFDALPNVRSEATVTEVGVAAGATAFPVTVQLTAPLNKVRAGMAAEVLLRFGKVDRKRRIFVPTHAVLEDAKGRYVYLARGELGARATIERRAVTVGKLGLDGIEITDGLKGGEHLVTAGLRFVEPGLTVRLLARTVAPPSPEREVEP
jgi:RND family efflux transporter MFP subunit